jgi:hypothetical protein
MVEHDDPADVAGHPCPVPSAEQGSGQHCDHYSYADRPRSRSQKLRQRCTADGSNHGRKDPANAKAPRLLG